MKRRSVLAGLGATAAAGALGMPSILRAQAPIALNGAVQFNDDHAFTKALVRFEELVQKYYGKPVAFTLHKNSSLGLEKQYFEYMSQGKAVVSSPRLTCRRSPRRRRLSMPRLCSRASST